MRLLLWFILMFSFLAIGFQDFLFAQPTLKQIVNIPWGTDKDYVRAVISKTSKGYIIASSLTIDHLGKGVKNNSFRVFTLDGRITFEFQPRQTQYFSADLICNGTVYCHNLQDMVYRHRLETNTVDSMRVKFAPLYFLERQYQGRKTLLVTGTGNAGYSFYDFNTLQCLQTISPQGSLSNTGCPPVAGEVMFCLMKKNELVGYSLKNKHKLWSIVAPAQATKWLGVTVGTSDDIFSHYALSKDTTMLYATTMSGCLYKINATTGAVIKLIDKFRGAENNAGLITQFALADVNGDGVEDLIGSAVDYNIYAISGKDLSVLWAYNTGYENQAGVALYDVTGDGVVDVFTINDKMKLSIINGRTGTKIHEHQIQPEKGQAKVILADINNNGLLDVFISGGSKAIRAYEMPSMKVPVGGIFWMPEG